jgi:vacuolar-type H+-ATPase subunit E/Vma4
MNGTDPRALEKIASERMMNHSTTEEEYVTPSMCELHHQIMEAKLEVLRQRDKALEDRMTGVEQRLDKMDAKIDKVILLQESIYKALIAITIGVVITLGGVILGRALDFGWLIGI